MSQNAFEEPPFFSGTIQYSPSPLESPASKMCLQDSAAANLNIFHFFSVTVQAQLPNNVLTGMTRLIEI